MAGRLASTRAADALSAAVVLVDGRPGATFCLFLRNAPVFVALFNMLRFPFLLVGVFRLVAAWHWFSPALRDFCPINPDLGRKFLTADWCRQAKAELE